MVNATYDDILAYLIDEKIKAEFQKETGQIYFVMQEEQRQFPVFVRLFEGSELLQIISFLPPPLQKETLGETARILQFINKELDFPGFGMDEMAGVTFYRVMIPYEKKKISKELIRKFILASRTACKMFSPTVEGIVQGLITVDNLLKQAESKAQQPPKE